MELCAFRSWHEYHTIGNYISPFKSVQTPSPPCLKSTVFSPENHRLLLKLTQKNAGLIFSLYVKAKSIAKNLLQKTLFVSHHNYPSWHTVSAVKNETSKKITKKRQIFFLIFFPCVAPVLFHHKMEFQLVLTIFYHQKSLFRESSFCHLGQCFLAMPAVIPPWTS